MPASLSQALSPVAPSFHPRRSSANAHRVHNSARGHQASASSSNASCRGGGSSDHKSEVPRTNPPKFASKHLVAPPPRWYRPCRSHSPTATASSATDGRPYAFTHAGLSQEALDFVEYLALTPEEHASRKELIAEVESAATAIWGDLSKVFVYGSYALDVSLPTSDVDMAVLLPPDDAASPISGSGAGGANVLTALHNLAKKLSESPRLRANVIDQCRVPVVHIQDTWSGISGDVSMTVPCIAEVVEQQQAWLAAHPIAKPIVLLTKAALKQWGMHSTFTGGISSTCVYLLVRRFLEECAPSEPHHRRCGGVDPLLSRASSPQAGGMHGCHPSMSFECDSPTGLSTPGGATSPAETPRSNARSPTPFFPAVTGVVRDGLTGSQTPPPPSIQGSASSSFCQSSILAEAASPCAPASHQPLLSQQLLDFWRYCSHESFGRGFHLTNAFLPKSLMALDHQASPAINSTFDMSKGAFRIGEVQVLLRHSVAVLEQLAGTHPALVAPWSVQQPISPLSAVLTDPRLTGNAAALHNNARRRRCDHY